MSGRITPGQADCTAAPGINTVIDLTSLDWTCASVLRNRDHHHTIERRNPKRPTLQTSLATGEMKTFHGAWQRGPQFGFGGQVCEFAHRPARTLHCPIRASLLGSNRTTRVPHGLAQGSRQTFSGPNASEAAFCCWPCPGGWLPLDIVPVEAAPDQGGPHKP